MTNINENNESTAPGQSIPTDRRPLGFWLRLVDRQLTDAFQVEFEAENLSRREWMVLNLLAGDVDDERLARIAERSHKRGGKLFRRLAEQGWVTEAEGAWALTEDGRAQRDALKTRVDAVRQRVTGAVSSAEYATTVASLEAIARELGWDGTGKGHGTGRRGFGRGYRGFGHGVDAPSPSDHPGRPRGNAHHGFRPGSDPRSGFGPAGGECTTRPDHGHQHRDGDRHDHGTGRRHDARRAAGHGRESELSFERGFQAGFAASRDANSPS